MQTVYSIGLEEGSYIIHRAKFPNLGQLGIIDKLLPQWTQMLALAGLLEQRFHIQLLIVHIDELLQQFRCRFLQLARLHVPHGGNQQFCQLVCVRSAEAVRLSAPLAKHCVKEH